MKPGAITVLHNGVCVHNHFELRGDTSFTAPPSYKTHPLEGPIQLQNHGNPIRFRNIWVRKLKPIVGVHPRPKPVVSAEEAASGEAAKRADRK